MIATAYFSGVVAGAAAAATLVGTVDTGAPPEATFVGTVSTALVEAFEAPSIRSGFRIRLDGEWIDDADLVGDLEYRESIETPIVFAGFSLWAAPRYQVLTNRETWTRTPIEIWEANGPAGAEVERQVLDGVVLKGRQETQGTTATVRVEAMSRAGLFEAFELCREVEPLSGLTRGELVRQFCADAGIEEVDCPDGAEYTRPLQAAGQRLFEFLKPFIEPEGWKIRERPGAPLEFWVPELVAPPLAARATWRFDRGEIDRVEIEPPHGVPSRYLFKGFGAVFVDELGQETAQTVVEIRSIVAPKVATEYQAFDTGTVTPTGLSPLTPTLRLSARITDTKISRGSVLLSQETVEEGLYNPGAAHQITVASSATLTYLGVFIDEEGRYVLWPMQRLVETGRRRTDWTYDLDQTPIGERLRVWRWALTRSGARTVGLSVNSVDGAFLHGDQATYVERYESYRLDEEHQTARRYDDETGEEVELETESFGRYSIRAAIGPGVIGGLYQNLDGKGQSELAASWKRFGARYVRNITEGGVLLGVYEEKRAYRTGQILAGFGAYEWGEFDSNATAEAFGLVEVRLTAYNIVADDLYERVVYRPGEDPFPETISGKPPRPRYKSSPWSTLRQEPIELVVEDPVLEAWFGFRREVVSNDHVQSLEEAARVIARRRERALSHRVRIDRHQALAAIGDTIELHDPRHELYRRGLVVDRQVRRTLHPPDQRGSYTLEVRL